MNKCDICILYSCLGVIIEFKEKTYSVIEDVSVYNVTVVKKGNSMKDIEVNIFPSPETAKCEL